MTPPGPAPSPNAGLQNYDTGTVPTAWRMRRNGKGDASARLKAIGKPMAFLLEEKSPKPRRTRSTRRQILRLRKTIRRPSCSSVRTSRFVLTWATTYYVSSSTGNDANSGTSSSTPWQTIGHVNGQTFQPGDSILFKRGDVWNESLAPRSSGSSGNPITFDAYGTGAAPNLTGYYAVPSTAWVLVSGNAWKAPLPSTYTTINFCLFGSIWGQKVAAVSSNLTAQWDFYFANGYVYVYSVGNPASLLQRSRLCRWH